MGRLFTGIVGALLSVSFAQAAPQTLGGAVTLNFTGTFRTAVTSNASGECNGVVVLVPNNTSVTASTMTLLSFFTGGGSEQAAKPITINSAKTAFSCSVTVPYKWENVDPATTQMAIAYTVKGKDPGAFTCFPPSTACYVPGKSPGKKQQLLKIMPIPANGVTTTLAIAPAL